MITPEEAEKRAHDVIEKFVNDAGCEHTGDVANVLMKLASMCGLAMVAVVGRSEASARMVSVAANTSHANVSEGMIKSARRIPTTTKPH